MPAVRFTKMHGAGNDYIYLDGFRDAIPADLADLSVAISDRHRGVGADGLIVIEPSSIADARMRMFNADGSESEMCGNGIRCVAKYLFDHQLVSKETMQVETGAGILELSVSAQEGRVEKVRVDMGIPRLDPADIPTTLAIHENGDGVPGSRQWVEQPVDFGGHTFDVTLVSMGNPHCVIFVPELSDELVLGMGPLIESHSVFPNRTNVEFVQILSRNCARQRTWERGSGETQACGTGASAVCVAGVLSGRMERQIELELLGGRLEIEWNESNRHVYKTGPAVEVCQGTYQIA